MTMPPQVCTKGLEKFLGCEGYKVDLSNMVFQAVDVENEAYIALVARISCLHKILQKRW